MLKLIIQLRQLRDGRNARMTRRSVIKEKKSWTIIHRAVIQPGDTKTKVKLISDFQSVPALSCFLLLPPHCGAVTVCEGGGFHCKHICCKICKGRFLESTENNWASLIFSVCPVIKSFRHGAICNRNREHRGIWSTEGRQSFSLILVSEKQTAHTCFEISPQQQKIWTSHYDFFRIWEIVVQCRKIKTGKESDWKRQWDVTDLLRRRVLNSVPLSHT